MSDNSLRLRSLNKKAKLGAIVIVPLGGTIQKEKMKRKEFKNWMLGSAAPRLRGGAGKSEHDSGWRDDKN